MVQVAGKEIPTPDAVVIGAGVVMVVDLFLPWYRVSFLGVTASANAFDAGFAAWFGALLVIATAAIVAGRIFSGFALPTTSKAGPALILLAVSGLGALLILLRLLTETSATFLGIYLGLAAAVAQAFFVFQAFRASGESLPDFGNRGTPPA